MEVEPNKLWILLVDAHAQNTSMPLFIILLFQPDNEIIYSSTVSFNESRSKSRCVVSVVALVEVLEAFAALLVVNLERFRRMFLVLVMLVLVVVVTLFWFLLLVVSLLNLSFALFRLSLRFWFVRRGRNFLLALLSGGCLLFAAGRRRVFESLFNLSVHVALDLVNHFALTRLNHNTARSAASRLLEVAHEGILRHFRNHLLLLLITVRWSDKV